MARIREDLNGVVHTDQGVLRAGDEIPEGVSIGGHLTVTGEPAGPFVATVSLTHDGHEVSLATDVPRALTEEELAEAEGIGMPTTGHPTFVRGALVGYAQGYVDGLATFEEVTAPADPVEPATPAQDEVLDLSAALFDPAEHDAPAVHEYLKAHPEDAERVIAAELAGKARTGILKRYAA